MLEDHLPVLVLGLVLGLVLVLVAGLNEEGDGCKLDRGRCRGGEGKEGLKGRLTHRLVGEETRKVFHRGVLGLLTYY